MATMNNFFNVPLFQENNDQHQLEVQLTLDGDTMELTYSELILDTFEHVVDSATFDAKAVREHYHAANNQELIARLMMDYSIGGNGATVYDDLIAYLHENGIHEIG